MTSVVAINSMRRVKRQLTASLEWLNLNQEDVKWHKQRHLMPISRH
jgi:hypothetical protein